MADGAMTATFLAVIGGAVAFVSGLRDQDAINLQLLGGVWIPRIFPAVAVGLCTRRPHPRALLAGRAVGMAAGTYLVVREGFSSTVPLGSGAGPLESYAGTAALARLGVPRGADATDLPSRLMVRRGPRTGADTP